MDGSGPPGLRTESRLGMGTIASLREGDRRLARKAIARGPVWAQFGLPLRHRAAAFAFSGAVAPGWPAAGVVCGAWAVLVAGERVHSGAHYPSDVAAGAVLGLAAAALVRAAPHLLRRRVL